MYLGHRAKNRISEKKKYKHFTLTRKREAFFKKIVLSYKG